MTVAYLHSNEVAHSFHNSLLNLVMADAAGPARLTRGGYIALRCGSNGIPEARNLATKKFLHETDSEWLFFVDTDMAFTEDSLERLMEFADPEKRPIVGGLCFAQKEGERDGMSGFRCYPRVTILDFTKDERDGLVKPMGRSRWMPNSLVRCGATGAAFIVIHRSVFERMEEEYPGEQWWTRVKAADGSLYGEDISFCVRAATLDIPVHVHTGVRTTHLKHLWLSEVDYWRAYQPPPAREEVAVLVPVMQRPENAEPFMGSLKASTGLATVYAIADKGDDDTAKAWKEAGARVIEYDSGTGEPGSFAEKVNLGFNSTSQPWVFITGDDVMFHPGWLDHAEHFAEEFRCSVVGTNDLANPRVTSGEHATHMLISRRYVEEHGGSWDGPGVLAHEGYGHNFVDDEIVTAAKQRGEFVSALGALVEHFHPFFEKGEMDPVYERGLSTVDMDQALFKRRYRENVIRNAPTGVQLG